MRERNGKRDRMDGESVVMERWRSEMQRGVTVGDGDVKEREMVVRDAGRRDGKRRRSDGLRIRNRT